MPHKNDMSVWDTIGCTRGCESHATRTAQISLGGPTRYGDLTSIPMRFAQNFEIEIWDTEITPVDGGPYCPARDAVSETILSHGVWEPQETAILLCCFEAMPGGLFIDFGSQIGWFSTLAVIAGMNVVAFDADADCVDVTARNLSANAPILSSFGAHYERLAADSAPFSIIDHPDLSVVAKIDVEGAEVHAIAKLQPLIDSGWVKYLMIEISPVFNDTYPDLVVNLMADGFVPYLLPPKQRPAIQIDRLYDLVDHRFASSPEEAHGKVNEIVQCDMLFAYGGLQ